MRLRPDERTCVVLCGGNSDASLLARVIEQVLIGQGRYLVLHTSDRPGKLARRRSTC